MVRNIIQNIRNIIQNIRNRILILGSKQSSWVLNEIDMKLKWTLDKADHQCSMENISNEKENIKKGQNRKVHNLLVNTKDMNFISIIQILNLISELRVSGNWNDIQSIKDTTFDIIKSFEDSNAVEDHLSK
jgi:hypothetical protein